MTYVDFHQRTQSAHAADGRRQAAIFVFIAMRAIQAIDFQWLHKRGFRFHQYCAPQEGASHEDSEICYYCWPSAPATGDWATDTHGADDMVPGNATSIEGVTGIVLSPDLTMVLLVWERRMWSSPGGAVNEGESKLDALVREVREEANVEIDAEWTGMCYLGGWQQSKSRNGLTNDNFSVLAVKAKEMSFRPDGKEIVEAHWFPIQQVLECWEAAGRPIGSSMRIELPSLSDVEGIRNLPADRCTVHCNLLTWMDTYYKQAGLPVHVKQTGGESQAEGVKLLFNSSR